MKVCEESSGADRGWSMLVYAMRRSVSEHSIAAPIYNMISQTKCNIRHIAQAYSSVSNLTSVVILISWIVAKLGNANITMIRRSRKNSIHRILTPIPEYYKPHMQSSSAIEQSIDRTSSLRRSTVYWQCFVRHSWSSSRYLVLKITGKLNDS